MRAVEDVFVFHLLGPATALVCLSSIVEVCTMYHKRTSRFGLLPCKTYYCLQGRRMTVPDYKANVVTGGALDKWGLHYRSGSTGRWPGLWLSSELELAENILFELFAPLITAHQILNISPHCFTNLWISISILMYDRVDLLPKDPTEASAGTSLYAS